jgi:hypothetical protein
MPEAKPRLATSAWVNALLRRVHSKGATGVVLAKGDATAGSVILVQRRRSGVTTAWYLVPDQRHGRVWSRAREQTDGRSDQIDEFLEKQRRFDRDLWVIELDVEELAQLIDEPMIQS